MGNLAHKPLMTLPHPYRGGVPNSQWLMKRPLGKGDAIVNRPLLVNTWNEGKDMSGPTQNAIKWSSSPLSSSVCKQQGCFYTSLWAFSTTLEQQVEPLWIKGQNQEGCWLPSPQSPLPSHDSINHFWQVAGKQLRMTVLLWSTGSHLLTRLLLFVSRKRDKGTDVSKCQLLRGSAWSTIGSLF